MTCVLLKNLTKQFVPGNKAVNDLTLEITSGKITAMLGPSGCGKTTTLKMIAGLLAPTAGDILFDGQSVLSLAPEKRGAVMVFQNHLLFPYLNVADNVAFGLKMRGASRAEIRRQVDEMLELVQLTGYERNKPGELSGGQQQRVALARALVVKPRILLLDEPLSNLDAHLREEMRESIRNLQSLKNITTLFVTHDQEEAVILADQLALLFDGTLHQVDQPRVFYDRPANVKVARFFGAGNFIAGHVDDHWAETAVGKFHIADGEAPSGLVQLIIRPEAIKIVSGSFDSENKVTGLVQSVVFNGATSRLKIQKEACVLEVLTEPEIARDYQPGDLVNLYLPAEKLRVLSE